MSVTVDFMNASSETAAPSASKFQLWSNSALAATDQNTKDFNIGIRLIDESESAELNQSFRQKKGATNVLSFSYDDLPIQTDEPELLGDLAICSQVVLREAQEQNKDPDSHWAHMTVHGTLHLLGYDHQHNSEAETMEKLETQILQNLGYAKPY